MSDIVERLQKECPCSSDIGCADALCQEAADEIARLRAENERMREALVPFAKEAEQWAAYAANNDLWDGVVEGYKAIITMSDCRRAAAALKENSDE